MTKELKCVRCANGDARTVDGFHLMSAGHYRRCADLPPYEQPAMLTSKDVLQRLENWGIDDADSEELYALLADAARELRETRAGLAACNQVLQQERSAHETSRRIPTNADVDYVLQVYKPEVGPDREYVYVDSPTVPGLHCMAETAEKALAVAPAQVAQLRRDNGSPEEPTPVIDCTACPHPDACEAAGGCYTDATPENGEASQP